MSGFDGTLASPEAAPVPTVLDRLGTLEVAPFGPLALRRPWPRGTDRLSLEYVDASGSTLAGQWFADHRRAAHILGATPDALGPAAGIVLQPDGADRRLRVLRHLARESGATLVVHRPERRGVVHRASGRYTKVVRPDRVGELLASDHRARRLGTVTLAPLVDHDPARGTVSWAAAPGRSLHELLLDPSVTRTELGRAGRAIGCTMRALHGERPPEVLPIDLPTHRPGDELEAAARWVRAAARLSHVPPGAIARLEDASHSLAGQRSPVTVVHRDLHDKQLLVNGDEVVVLDVDTLAVGEPAVDLANLLVHLDLRVLQGIDPSRSDAVRSSLLAAYRPDRATWSRLPGYRAATRARLAGVYAFRPRETTAASNVAVDAT